MRTITPEKRRRALIVGVVGGIAVVTIVSLQMIITIKYPPKVAEPTDQEIQTNINLINGVDSLKESVTGLQSVTQEAWGVVEQDVQNQ